MTLVLRARRLLPPGIAVAGGAIADWQGPVSRAEAAAMTRAVPDRRAAFAAGRTAARAALGQFGLQTDLPPRPDGPPVWPPGMTGSITHGGGACLAAVAPKGAFAALGLDMERARALAADLVGAILSPAEIGRLGDLDPTLFFCAKEAAYKAQFTLTGRMLDPADMDVTPTDDHLVVRTPAMVMSVRTDLTDGLIIAATAVPA